LEEERLVELAHRAREKAYAPYSNFRVGAALLAESGRVYLGCNVENRSYYMTVCAERNAVAAAVCGGERKFVAIAISSESSPPASPCGACRQVLSEFSSDLRVIMVNEKGEKKVSTIRELLPEPFGGEDA
jgi:cytidine deaminase